MNISMLNEQVSKDPIMTPRRKMHDINVWQKFYNDERVKYYNGAQMTTLGKFSNMKF